MKNMIEYTAASNNLTRMHEIGHATVAILLGAKAVSIKTKAQGGSYHGLPITEIDMAVFQRWLPDEKLIFLAAGYSGELLYKEIASRNKNNPDSQFVSKIFKEESHISMRCDFQTALENGVIENDERGEKQLNLAIEKAFIALNKNWKLCSYLLFNLQKKSHGLSEEEITAAVSEIGLISYR